MLSLFEDYNLKNKYPTVKPGVLDFVARSYMRDMNRVINYYRHRVKATLSNHLLCKIINVATSSLELPLEKYMQITEARAPYISKLFRLTSSIDYGRIHYGVFQDEDIPNILLSVEEYFDIFDDYMADDKWMKLTPVKCIGHEDSSMSLHLPDGDRHTTTSGASFYTIDIPLLMFQYRCFLLHRQKVNDSGNSSVIGIPHFVHMYVLPNIIKSYVNIMMINRFCNLITGRPMDDRITRLPFLVIDYRQELDKAYSQIIKMTSHRKMEYEAYLRDIPTLPGSDGQSALQLPKMFVTRQCNWIFMISRLSIIKVLMKWGGDEAQHLNSVLLNTFRLKLKHMLIGNELSAVLGSRRELAVSSDLYSDVIQDIAEIEPSR